MSSDSLSRRRFLRLAAGAGGLLLAPRLALAQGAVATPVPAPGLTMPPGMAMPPLPLSAAPPPGAVADYTFRIAPGLIELSPTQIISTNLYNNQFPGPLLRLKEGQKVVVDIYNDTDSPEQLHWHGQFLPVDVDGSEEEGTPNILPHSMRRIAFTPAPSGFRFYHTHVRAGLDLRGGLFGGLLGPVFIEPKQHAGDYDQEVFLTLKEFEPFFTKGDDDMAMNFLASGPTDPALETMAKTALDASLAKGMPRGYEVVYPLFAINGRMLGHGDPIRVRQGQRVLFHILNGSASEIRSLALPGHTFHVVALDGNALAAPVEVPVLWLGTAERVSAYVEMKNRGVWVMGDLIDDVRTQGMGIIIEYAGSTGQPKWIAPAPYKWDYTLFATPGAVAQTPDETIDMLFTENNAADHGFNIWMINGVPFSMEKMTALFSLHEGKRYRLRLRNASDDIHPLHLHRHSFEITKYGGKPTAGVIKDVVMLDSYREIEIDFTANNPGLTLFHCHMQQHMDFGFMALFKYV